ncbi:MAG: alpha/beta hydrolase [Thermodesulfobacteriota bacterium]
MRKDVVFKSEGLDLAAWLYLPDSLASGAKAPAVVMSHGLGGVKEMYLDPIARTFEKAGFVVLLFDYRFQGGSQGEPRGRIVWYEQIEDCKNAITYASLLKEVDPNRIGYWGTSFGGAHSLYLGAYDGRIKVVVSQVPAVDVRENLLRFNTPEFFNLLQVMFAQDRAARFSGQAGAVLPLVSPDGQNCAMIGVDVYEWSMKAYKEVAPSWVNQVTLESIEKALEYNPGAGIHLISPKPLLLIVCRDDTLTPVDLQIEAYQRAREPKKLQIIPAGHFSVYAEPWQSRIAGWSLDWFKTYL